jgi:hypothetical protein
LQQLGRCEAAAILWIVGKKYYGGQHSPFAQYQMPSFIPITALSLPLAVAVWINGWA